jgi:glutathione peroxidase
MTNTPLTDIALTTLDGKPTTLAELANGAALVVNVASKCGLTPQYSALEKIAQDYRDRGLTVIGVPCNQFMGQEPGTAEEIQAFCSTTYGVTFPLLAKIDVNGSDRHPLFAALTETPDASGEAGDVQWNFEKFLLAPGGEVVKRFRPRTEPDAPEVVEAIEAVLPQ